MGNPRGIDVSSHNPGIDWQAVAASGVEFAFIKATQGNGYRNPEYPAQWAGAKAAGILRGAYHFFRWDTDPLAQATYFLQAVSGDLGELPLTVDVENTGDGAGNGPKDPAKVRVFVDAIRVATGKAPIIYTYTSMWRDTLGNPTTFTDCLLWLAAYQSKPPAPVGGWPVVTFWQFTSTGTVAGVPGQIDMNYFMGSSEDLQKLAGLPAPDPGVYVDPVTGYTVAHGFRDYMKNAPYLGRPLTNEFTQTLEDGNDWIVQLFERGLLQWRMGASVSEARIGFMWGKATGKL